MQYDNDTTVIIIIVSSLYLKGEINMYVGGGRLVWFPFCNSISFQFRVYIRQYNYTSVHSIISCNNYDDFLKTEIIKEVETDGEKLTELLRNNTDQLEPNCLNRALMAATRNDNHFNIGKLVVKGAKNLDACLEYAQTEKKPHARAMLLLIKAASSGNKSIVQKLFGEAVDKPDNLKNFPDNCFPEVQKAVLSGKVSTVVPIEIARRNGHIHVQEELLLKTNVNQNEGYVYWHDLRLLQLEVPWLRRINWVKRLRLARNGFNTLPNDMGNYLKQVDN